MTRPETPAPATAPARARRVVDWCVGERREVTLDAHGAPIELILERWSDSPDRPRLGERRCGRIVSAAAHLDGAFVDLGPGGFGFLTLRGAPAPIEGAQVTVEVSAEAAEISTGVGQKGPRLTLCGDEDQPAQTRQPGPAHAARAAKLGSYDAQARAIADAALDEALAVSLRLEGGGQVTIEPTRALVAIDVDAGDRPTSWAGAGGQAGGRAGFAARLNQDAGRLIARQISLRALAGLIVIDAVSGAGRAANEALCAQLAGDLQAFGVAAQIAPMSRFGLVEMAVRRTRPALHEIVTQRGEALSVESLALEGLRALEREGRANPGARLRLQAHRDVIAWLEDDVIDWRGALIDRLGPRFSLVPRDGVARDHLDAHATT